MASIHKDPRGKSPFWYVAFTDQTGKRRFKSSGTRSEKDALKVAAAWQKAVDLALSNAITPERARKLIDTTVQDVAESAGGRGLQARALAGFFRQAAELAEQGQFTSETIRPRIEETIREVAAAAGQPIPTERIGAWCERWLADKEVEAEPTTHTRYSLAIRDFIRFLGKDAERDLTTINQDRIQRWRSDCATRLAVGSVNTNLKILRACLNTAYKAGLIDKNTAALVPTLKKRGESKRRALTLDEVRSILEVCGNSPWRGLVLVGLYTGQRLGDCARLTWGQVDLPKQTIHFVTTKTGKRLEIHMAKPLAGYLEALPSADTPSAPVFPDFAKMAEAGISSLSNAFAMEVLIPAKLMLPRREDKKSSGKGRGGKRSVNAVTFHSLRHSFVTMLKATGASNAMAQMIVGHDSQAVNRRYTHLDAADTAGPINNLPDVTDIPGAKKDSSK